MTSFHSCQVLVFGRTIISAQPMAASSDEKLKALLKRAIELGAEAAYTDHRECREPGCVREDAKVLAAVLEDEG